MILELLALSFAAVHFTVPLAYYWYAKTRWLPKPWDIKTDESYRPRLTVILPTYNEARHIVARLDNIYEQDYPKELMEVIVVDSASTDGTPRAAEEWAKSHGDIKVWIISENSRSGMVPAINFVLRTLEPSGDILVLTDADAKWPKDALRSIVKYFADERVGAVTASIIYENSGRLTLENSYRTYYNKLRVAESKKHSTPVHNGPLVAFRKSLLYRIGLLPEYTGNDDSTPASVIAFMGYRAIQVDDVLVEECIEDRRNQFWRRVRRAQHLLAHFTKTKRYAKDRNLLGQNRDFEMIWRAEWYLHVVNPWLLPASLAFLAASLIFSLSINSLALLFAGGTLLLASKTLRVWILQQLYLVTAAVRNLKSLNIAWEK